MESCCGGAGELSTNGTVIVDWSSSSLLSCVDLIHERLKEANPQTRNKGQEVSCSRKLRRTICRDTIKAAKMSTLFGSSSTTTTQQNNTLGDLSKDVALTNPTEDSISDITFSTQSSHLAVASWDKKVRIYEINAQGGSEGKAMMDFEGPVLSVDWSKVCAPS